MNDFSNFEGMDLEGLIIDPSDVIHAREDVEAMGGTVFEESPLPKGETAFKFAYPQTDEAKEAAKSIRQKYDIFCNNDKAAKFGWAIAE